MEENRRKQGPYLPLPPLNPPEPCHSLQVGKSCPRKQQGPPQVTLGPNLEEASASLLAARAPRKESPDKVPWRSGEATAARPGTKELHSPGP